MKSSEPKRPYVLRARQQHVVKTRARIVEAIMALHEEVGPRNTTVSAIADRAGVERLTVYRHFKDDAAMFAACSHRYLELNPPPDSSLWAHESDPVQRARHGLSALYSFFNRTGAMFEKVYRDMGELQSLREILRDFDRYLRNLADDLASAWPGDKPGVRRRIILRHAAKFSTWQSLDAEGVDDGEKVALILHWLRTNPGGVPDFRRQTL